MELSRGDTPCILGGGPQGVCLRGWLGIFKGEGWEQGCGRKRDVHIGGDGVFCEAGTLRLDVNAPSLSCGKEWWIEWMGFCGNGVNSKWKIGGKNKT